MKIIGLNGKTYSWHLVGHVVLGDDEQRRSKYHLAARELLTELYPLDRLLEEVPLPGSGGLTCDFYISAIKTMVEVHGEQHYKYIKFFHEHLLGFANAKRRDSDKREWCRINNITLVELPYMESKDEWRNRLRKGKDGEATGGTG